MKNGVKSPVVFILKNRGKHPLIIQHVATSCGCTVAEWEKQPRMPDQATYIKVEMQPEEIDVHYNTEESPLKLKISGKEK